MVPKEMASLIHHALLLPCPISTLAENSHDILGSKRSSDLVPEAILWKCIPVFKPVPSETDSSTALTPKADSQKWKIHGEKLC